MDLSRREFLKLAGAGVGSIVMFKGLGSQKARAASRKAIPLRKRIGESSTICPYDASGCGFLVATENGHVVNIEGDPEHPVNRGGACSKGASMRQIAADNPWRLSKVLYRAPNGTAWEEKSWDWALDQIARRIKDTRDASFIEMDGDKIVNRTEAIANLGGSALDNEECYLLAKLVRALGVVYLEHHARI